MESERHDAVAEDHGVLLPAVAVDHVDHVRDFALGHELVHGIERNLRRLRQHLAEHDADPAWCRATSWSACPCRRRVEAILDLAVSVMTLAVSACSIDAMLPKVLPWPGSLSRISDR